MLKIQLYWYNDLRSVFVRHLKGRSVNFLLDPNVAYVMLVGGFLLAILALFSPGTGLLELGALFMLALAGYGIANLPINAWALVILVVGVIPFILALRRTRQWWWLIPALAALVVGSIFLFTATDGSPTVNPWLASLVSVLVVPFVWLVGRKSLEALSIPAASLNSLIGMVGEARTEILNEGSVYVNGEDWSARSKTRIPAGAKVRVLSREGLVLEVEKKK